MSPHGQATAWTHEYNHCTVILMAASLKRLICRVLIGVLLSAQFAVAAYACPELSSAQHHADVLALTGLTDGSAGHESQAAASPVAWQRNMGGWTRRCPTCAANTAVPVNRKRNSLSHQRCLRLS